MMSSGIIAVFFLKKLGSASKLLMFLPLEFTSYRYWWRGREAYPHSRMDVEVNDWLVSVMSFVVFVT